MAGHTPGPWRHETYGGQEIVQRSFSGGFVVQGDDPARAKADALLIAAAPELLHALWMARILLFGTGLTDPTIDAAIDKAGGLL